MRRNVCPNVLIDDMLQGVAQNPKVTEGLSIWRTQWILATQDRAPTSPPPTTVRIRSHLPHHHHHPPPWGIHRTQCHFHTSPLPNTAPPSLLSRLTIMENTEENITLISRDKKRFAISWKAGEQCKDFCWHQCAFDYSSIFILNVWLTSRGKLHCLDTFVICMRCAMLKPVLNALNAAG